MSLPAPWTVVLDDDPTGSQVVHQVEAVFGTDPDQVLDALRAGGGRSFVLTNSRSMRERDAVAATESVAEIALAAAPGGRVRLVSRSDSTLRGHVYAEVEALQRARARATDRRHDAVLFVPAFPQAGRTTLDGVHRALVGGLAVPVAQTEYARDVTFGYSSSRLPDFVEEASGGRVAAADVLHLSLAEVRQGAQRIAELLGTADGRWVTADALGPADLDAIAGGARLLEDRGATVVYRTGPGMVPSILDMDGEHVVTFDEVAAPPTADAHGLVVVGSHTALTTRQVEIAVARHSLRVVELDVPRYVDSRSPDELVDTLGDRVAAALHHGPAVLMTTRERVDLADAETSLALARQVSAGLAGVVRRVLDAVTPRWIVLKGGITSHDVALHGLGASRARVLGQVFPGKVGVFKALVGPLAGGSFVVFPGNVGDELALAHTVALLQGDRARPHVPQELEGERVDRTP